MNINYSFIIPHKNCPDLLQRCVDSIPERVDVQVIVVDDNSDADKKPALKERKNLQVKLLDASQSKGAGRARNVGLEHAEGKWLLFADADDYYVVGFLEVLDKYVEGKAEVIYFNSNFIDGKTGAVLPQLSMQKRISFYDGSQINAAKIRLLNKVPWNKMVLHNLVKEYDIKFEEVPNGNDILFSLRVGYYSTSIKVEKQVLYSYIRTENSILTSKPSVSGALCKLEHRVKLNMVFKSLGYPQWTESCLRIILMYSVKNGIPFFISFIKHLPLIYKSRKEWVKMLK